MRYIKLYEELNVHEPKVGDWVILQLHSIDFLTVLANNENEKFNNYINIHIGKIVSYMKNSYMEYGIFYENFPEIFEDLYRNPVPVHTAQIKYWSKNKEELQFIIDANKYNL
jgi:hypothetical protein